MPDTETLTRILQAEVAPALGHVTLKILGRASNRYASSSPIEIVTCADDAAGVGLTLFCKYDAGPEHAAGHRGGTRREALVYREVVGRLGLRPRLFGSYAVPDTGETWLFLEYLGDGWRLSTSPQPQSMRLAGEWIGRFHRLASERIDEPALAFLDRYDTDYYVSWIDATARKLNGDTAWLAPACRRAPDLLAVLAERPQTAVHGEFYPDNIVWLGEEVCPVDWESAAIGAGEIDLASLLHDWGPELESEAMREYTIARWAGTAPAGFDEALLAARLYWAFRWLAEPSAVADYAGLLNDTRSLCEASGLLT